MGGYGGTVMSAVSKAAGDFFDKYATEALGKYYRSTDTILSRYPVGERLAKYLSDDFEPAVKRSGQQYLNNKIASGMKPEQAAIEAFKESFQDNRKIYMGKRDEVLIKSIATATKLHGPAYGNSVADAMSVYFHDAYSPWRQAKIKTAVGGPSIQLTKLGIRGTSQYVAPKQVERDIMRGMSWMYTPLIAIPHASQIGNVVLNEGITSTAKAVSEYSQALMSNPNAKNQFMNDIMKSGVLFDELRFQMLEDAKGGGIVRKLFNHPGFGWVRRQELVLGALAGKNTLLDASEKYAKGIGTKFDKYNIERLGIDFNQLQQNGFKPSQEDLLKAMYQGGNQSIFINSELTVPPGWNENWFSRLATQYKHFAFRQGRFLSSVLRNNYEHGGLTQVAKTVGVLGTMFPVMGELVHSIENAATGRDPFEREKKGMSEYFDAIGHAAGFGIFYSMFRAGMWNYGKGFLEGPFFNTLEDIFIGLPTHLYKAGHYYGEGEDEKAERQLRSAARLGLSKLSYPGRFVSNKFLKEEK